MGKQALGNLKITGKKNCVQSTVYDWDDKVWKVHHLDINGNILKSEIV